jgi:hypothetical protein
MNIALLLIGIGLVLRSEAALLRLNESPWLMKILGWLLGTLAIWLAVIALGAWAVWWPILLVALVGGLLARYWQEKKKGWILLPMADGLLVVLTGLFSLPRLAWEILLPAAIFLPLLAFLIDQAVLWIARRVFWGWLAIAGIAPLLLLSLLPTTRDTATHTLEARFAYLFPQSSVIVPVTGSPPDAGTGSSQDAGTDTRQLPTAFTLPLIVKQRETNSLDAQGSQWTPYIEWRLPNSSYDGNPFDLEGSATFTHAESGERRTTGLFFIGHDSWAFRFSGTQPGEWKFRTHSSNSDLDGHQGTVWIEPNSDAAGFVTHYGNKWGWSGLERAFVPQYVMIDGPDTYYNKPAKIVDMIDVFILEHGFNGVHTPVFCRWFDIEQQQCGRINVADPNPDLRTFEALESLIREVHAAGGVVHIWMWGDDSRSENPKRWGLNGSADKRLQRYIAARLGPLPGWTMGYGYDLWEWIRGNQLAEWHDYMHEQMGWAHYLGARSGINTLDQLTEKMDYASYEQHRPEYNLYVETIEARPNRPAFSEDRFRIRQPAQNKDYTMEMTRRGLWHSTMAGGVANIWGNLIDPLNSTRTLEASSPYQNPEMIKTYALFFEDRFWADMVRCNQLTDGVCLMRPTYAHYVFYAEESGSMKMDLSGMRDLQVAVAVDTRLEYKEIELGALSAREQTWEAPYVSDWAIAVGDFTQTGRE